MHHLDACSFHFLTDHICFFIPPMNRNHSVCLSVEICVRSITFVLPWHWPIILGSWVYHHEKMCLVHSWSWYDVDLWPQGRICRVYDMALCSSHSFFVLWHSHTMFDMWDDVLYIHDLYMTLSFDLYVGGGEYSQWVLLTVLYLFQFSTSNRS